MGNELKKTTSTSCAAHSTIANKKKISGRWKNVNCSLHLVDVYLIGTIGVEQPLSIIFLFENKWPFSLCLWSRIWIFLSLYLCHFENINQKLTSIVISQIISCLNETYFFFDLIKYKRITFQKGYGRSEDKRFRSTLVHRLSWSSLNFFLTKFNYNSLFFSLNNILISFENCFHTFECNSTFSITIILIFWFNYYTYLYIANHEIACAYNFPIYELHMNVFHHIELKYFISISLLPNM